jgi:uncharacterized protein YecT (DUF1311 family)
MRLFTFATVVTAIMAVMASPETSALDEPAAGSTSSHAVPTVLADCTQDTQVAMNQCAYVHYDRAAKELDTLYQVQLKKLVDGDSYKELKAAQSAWSTFAALNCKYQAGTWEGGSGWPYIYYTCMATQVHARSSEMQSFVDCTQNGCPI